MSTHLLEIATRAQADKTYQFQNLSRELNEEFLLDCWKTIRRDAASGVDHVTVAQYQTHLEECFEFLGFEFRWGKDQKKRPHLKRRTASKKFRATLQRIAVWCRDNRHAKVREFFSLLSPKLRGHYSYYGVSGNSRRLKNFFQRTLWYAWRWLRRRNSRGKMTWEGVRARLDYYRILPPRIAERARSGVSA